MLQEKVIRESILNPITSFGDDWMALSAGNKKNGIGTMTIAFGNIGSLWGKKGDRHTMPVAICYVRENRYTKSLLDQCEYFTISYFEKDSKKLLGYLGSHSQRKENKIEKMHLTPVYIHDNVYFQEVKAVYICRKLYHQKMREDCFTDQQIVSFNYPKRDFHEMYIGEIVKMYVDE